MLLYEEFLRDLQFVRCCSSHTVSAYKRDLFYYREFCKTKGPVQEFYSFLTEKKLSSRSQARVISCVRTYLKFLQSRGHSAKDIKYLKAPNLKNKLPQPIQLEEFKLLWKACEGESKPVTLRNKMILSFLYGLGCRVSELTAMDIQNFNETERWISVIGKGNKQRLLPLTEELYKLLRAYFLQSRPFLTDKKHDSLFFNNRGNRPSRVDIWRWLKAWSLKAGFDEVKNPHSFRHGCATSLLDRGADLVSIQKLLGHLSIQTTQIYTTVSSEGLKKAVDKHHPLSQEAGK